MLGSVPWSAGTARSVLEGPEAGRRRWRGGDKLQHAPHNPYPMPQPHPQSPSQRRGSRQPPAICVKTDVDVITGSDTYIPGVSLMFDVPHGAHNEDAVRITHVARDGDTAWQELAAPNVTQPHPRCGYLLPNISTHLPGRLPKLPCPILLRPPAHSQPQGSDGP